jgi:hypothetical protein
MVQFSRFSAKKFLTFDHLQTSEFGNVRYYHIPLDVAHTTLARLWFTMLLSSEEILDKNRVETLPLPPFSARHWVVHVKFENVTLQFEDAMKRLFDPTQPHFETWTQICNIDDGKESRQATPLCYAVLCGFTSQNILSSSMQKMSMPSVVIIGLRCIPHRIEDISILCVYYSITVPM